MSPISATRWLRPIRPARRPIEANAAAYLGEARCARRARSERGRRIPADRRKIITTHDAFGYFGAAYGIAFIAPQGVSTEVRGVGARRRRRSSRRSGSRKSRPCFWRIVTDDRAVAAHRRRSGARIGGTLYSDALTDEKGDAPTYIDMMRHNVRELTSA